MDRPTLQSCVYISLPNVAEKMAAKEMKDIIKFKF